MFDKHLIWMAVATVLIADQWGFWWALGIFVALEGVMTYANAFYAAWKDDKRHNKSQQVSAEAAPPVLRCYAAKYNGEGYETKRLGLENRP